MVRRPAIAERERMAQVDAYIEERMAGKDRDEALERSKEDVGTDDLHEGSLQSKAQASSTDMITPIYNAETGDVSITPLSQLRELLRRRDANGVPIYQLTEPLGFDYIVDSKTGWPRRLNKGAVKCLLHPDHERRKEFVALGIAAECPAANIPNAFQVRMHMQRKHRAEWAAIQELEQDRENRRQSNLLENQIKIMQMLAENRTEVEVIRHPEEVD